MSSPNHDRYALGHTDAAVTGIRRRTASAEESKSASVADFEARSRSVALDVFVNEIRRRFGARFPGVAYDSPQFDFRKTKGQTDSKGRRLTLQDIHKTDAQLSRPNLVEHALAKLHPTFALAARAIIAERVLVVQSKATEKMESGLRSLSHLHSLRNARSDERFEDDRASMPTLFELTTHDLRHVERCVLTSCLTPQTRAALEREKMDLGHLIVPEVEMRGLSARNNRNYLIYLYKAVATLVKANVIAPMRPKLDEEVSELLLAIDRAQNQDFRDQKDAELEPGIPALSDAINAMADGDSKLSEIQMATLCVMGLEMCAPSRINEVLTTSVAGRLISTDAYREEPVLRGEDAAAKSEFAEARLVHLAHKEIEEAAKSPPPDSLPDTLLMKGSKGRAWGPKPVLDFMLTMFNECFDRLIGMGQRSRMLVEHYERHPNRLFLPPELEHYRYRPLTVIQIGRVMSLDAELGVDHESFKTKAAAARSTAQVIGQILGDAGLMFTLAQRPDIAHLAVNDRESLGAWADEAFGASRSGRSVPAAELKLLTTDSKSRYAEWSDVEAELLKRVHKAMDSIRWVTSGTRYEGRLSRMLVLFDHALRTPNYLPGAISDKDVASRLNSNSRGKGQIPAQTVFEALEMSMAILGEGGAIQIVPAYCRTHDPRRWLTTMALRHAGPKLSRLLINLWANRADVGQLPAYDYRKPTEAAAATAQRVPEAMRSVLNEHDDLSRALNGELLGDYGLKTQSITVGAHEIRVTTMEAIHAAETNHPVARAGGKVILIYPTPFGACLHQHHEAGCTNYHGCESACSDQRVVKGHLPTNDRVRERSAELQDVIVAQVRRLTLARNRRVAHDLDALDQHIVRMIQLHMNSEMIAERLISGFHEIKDFIKDAAFKTVLEDAYAFKGTVDRLDDPKVPSGALIRYFNPERHGRPETERSLQTLGGRQAIEGEIEVFIGERDWASLGASPDELMHELVEDQDIEQSMGEA